MNTTILQHVGADPVAVPAGCGDAQRRFCRCGRPVFVRYRHGGVDGDGLDWNTEFAFSQRRNAASLCRCPACGRVLEIDGLR